MKQENGNNAAKSTATAKVVKAPETTKAPVTPVAANTGFKVVPVQSQADGYDELLECVEELRVSIRNINEHLLNLSKKIREHHASFKRREKDMKAARDAIEKLKVSGF